MGDVQPTTSYEPKDLAENDDLCHAIILPQTEYNFDLRFCCEHCDTPPESDLDDEQIRALLASPLYFQEREVSADRSRVYHSVRENLVSSSSPVPKSTGDTRCVVFKQKEIESRNTFRQRRMFLRTSTSSRKQRTSIQIL